jgi:hypothetical protein
MHHLHINGSIPSLQDSNQQGPVISNNMNEKRLAHSSEIIFITLNKLFYTENKQQYSSI